MNIYGETQVSQCLRLGFESTIIRYRVINSISLIHGHIQRLNCSIRVLFLSILKLLLCKLFYSNQPYNDMKILNHRKAIGVVANTF